MIPGGQVMLKLDFVRAGILLALVSALGGLTSVPHAAAVSFTEAAVDSAFWGHAGVYVADIEGGGCTDLVAGVAYADDDLPEFGPPRLLGNHPNPFGPLTVIGFELGRASHVKLAVYDISGRHVATLIDGTLAAGRHSVEWDGRDRAGSEVPAGVYFLRIAAGGRADAGSVTLLR
jgi:hypothetical protein